jgi:hypothetical protein
MRWGETPRAAAGTYGTEGERTPRRSRRRCRLLRESTAKRRRWSMKKGRTMRRAVCVASLVGVMVLGLSVLADTVENFFGILARFEDASTRNLAAAMYMLDDETSDVEGDVATLREQFMSDPRGYLNDHGVDLPPSEYWIMAFDFAALRELPTAFSESPLVEGVAALPYTIGWMSHKAAILVQLAALPEEAEPDRNYAPVGLDASTSQEILRSVVGTPDALLRGMLQILVQVTTDDELRAECTEIGLRQFAADRDLRFDSDRYALQFVNFDPVDGPAPEPGIHYTMSEGAGSRVPESVGFVMIEEGASYGLVINETF